MFYNSPKHKHNFCAIYRGAGGAGDATGDSASEALLVRELAAEVQLDADAAEAAKIAAQAAQAAAETAKTNAETAETNAELAETNAETAQAAAASSASAASTSASNAASSASSASTSATNAANSATAAAGSASAASTSATNAAASASSASASASTATTQATNAANSASAAATSESNAAASASAAATSATNAANSATSASNSATTATTQAGIATTQAGLASTSASNAATSESNAAASASAAATSATNSANSATASATSATNSANSASAAATSASNASSSEIAAAASAAAAAASYDSFDDRYLGAKSSAPTLDNDGNALIAGALYYNDGTVTAGDKGMYVYDGSQWIAASAASTAILVVYQYTATGGQTTFSGTDNNSLTLAYTQGSALVTLNGVILEVGSEVTATTGTSVVLASGAVAGDELNVYAFSTFDIANVYTQAQSDATFLTKSNPSYTGTFTGGTGVVNIGSGQFYKDASGNVGIGTTGGVYKLDVVGAGAQSIRVASSNGDLATLRMLSSGNNEWSIASDTVMRFRKDSTEYMRIDSSGNVGIGTSSPTERLVIVNTSSTAEMQLRGGTTAANYSQIGLYGGSTRNAEVSSNSAFLTLDHQNSGVINFRTGGSERMRLDAAGNLLVGTTGAGSKVRVETSDNAFGIYVGASNASYSSELITVRPTRNTTNSTFYAYSYYNTTAAAYRFIVYDSGNVANTNNSYGAISDIKVKENIVDATPKLEKLNQVRIVNYNLIGEDKKQIGVIAQELEQIFPGMIDETLDRDADGNVLETTTKTVKYSVFVPMLIKAIQEQQAIITDLRTELDSLKSEVTALKGQA